MLPDCQHSGNCRLTVMALCTRFMFVKQSSGTRETQSSRMRLGRPRMPALMRTQCSSQALCGRRIRHQVCRLCLMPSQDSGLVAKFRRTSSEPNTAPMDSRWKDVPTRRRKLPGEHRVRRGGDHRRISNAYATLLSVLLTHHTQLRWVLSRPVLLVEDKRIDNMAMLPSLVGKRMILLQHLAHVGDADALVRW
jgi:hypothetical protein